MRMSCLIFSTLSIGAIALGIPQSGQAEILSGHTTFGGPGRVRSALVEPVQAALSARTEFASSAWGLGDVGRALEGSPQYALPNWTSELDSRFGASSGVRSSHARDYGRPAQGTLVHLGTLGGSTSEATCINVHGQAAGYAETRTGAFHAFAWDPQQRTMRDLGTLGGKHSYAQGINDRGDIVGYSETADGNVRAFVWTSADGTMRDLGTLGGQHSRAAAINNQGLVVGFAQTAEQADHAFVWDPAHRTLRDLGTFGGRASYAFDINDAGLVVGHAQHDNGVAQAFEWSLAGEQLEPVQSLDGLISYAFAVNARGQVSGYALLSSGQYHGYVAESSQRAVDLGKFSDDFTQAYRLDSDGSFRGYNAAPHGRNYGARWNPATGRLQDRSAIGSGMAVAWDVNSRGAVAGAVRSSHNVMRAAVWQPAVAGEGESDLWDCCRCSDVPADDPAPPEPISTDVGYQAGPVGMPGTRGWGGSSGGFAHSAGGSGGYRGGGGGGWGGGGGGGWGGSSGGGGSYPGGGEGEVPEPASLALWLSAALVAAGGAWARRRRARAA